MGADEVAGVPGLIVAVERLEQGDRVPRPVVRPQRLGVPVRVVADDRRGGIEDLGGGPVVLLQLDDAGVRVVLLELEDVADVGAPPPVDGLVVVADHAEVPVALRQQAQQPVLDAIGVLVLVDEDVTEAILILGEHGRMVAEEHDRAHEQIVEVQGAALVEPALVGEVQPGEHFVADGLRARGHGRGIHELVLGAADLREHSGGRELPLVHVQRADHLAHHRPLVVRVVDQEPGVDADGRAGPAEHPAADRVERPHPHGAGDGRADQPLHASAHLAGGLVREGDGQDPLRGHAPVANQRRDAKRQHPRLAGAGAGEDQERPVAVVDRLPLGGVEQRVTLGSGPRDGIHGASSRSHSHSIVAGGLLLIS